MPPYVHDTVITMGRTDAAGVMYFARAFELCHEAFEAYMTARGVGPADLVGRGGYLLPIAHAEADYRKPLALGERARVEMRAVAVSGASFTMGYVVSSENGAAAFEAKTVHVPISKESLRPIRLPERLREAVDAAGE
jgi:1,4-dihydroxy-2-naphthoyl-CoA hydrolase